MHLSLLSRYAFFACCVVTLLLLPFFSFEGRWLMTSLVMLLIAIGLRDIVQKRHAVRRNYPILGNIRYLVESIRPEIRQYLLEGDREALPFSRAQRALVYSRAKNEGADKPFGTLIDVYRPGHEFISHSMHPAPLPPCQNCCRLNRTKNLGAMKEERIGTVRTGIQGKSSSTIVAA
jgi:glutamate synthase domain-containing protein 2